MEKHDLIPAKDFCTYNRISYSIITGLQEAGLIEVVVIENQEFLQAEQLPETEKLVRMHTDLGINFEGIETIGHLLKRMEEMRQQMRILQERLRLYER